MTLVAVYGLHLWLTSHHAAEFPGRAAVPRGKQLTHRPQGQMGVSRLCTRDSLSLECRGGHTAEHPGCVVWDAAETHQRPRPSVASFSRQGEESERSGITLPDIRGWSTQSGCREWDVTAVL